MSIYGRITTGRNVEDAAEATLRLWMTHYLAEIERQNDLPPRFLEPVKTYVRANEFETWPEKDLPIILIIASGLEGEPIRRPKGRYDAQFGLGVAIIVKGRENSHADTRARAQYYAAAARAALLQHASLGGISEGLTWIDERYDPIPGRQRRSLGAGQVEFIVDVREIVSAGAGPRVPPTQPDPYRPAPDWPMVRRVEAEFIPTDEEDLGR